MDYGGIALMGIGRWNKDCIDTYARMDCLNSTAYVARINTKSQSAPFIWTFPLDDGLRNRFMSFAEDNDIAQWPSIPVPSCIDEYPGIYGGPLPVTENSCCRLIPGDDPCYADAFDEFIDGFMDLIDADAAGIEFVQLNLADRDPLIFEGGALAGIIGTISENVSLRPHLIGHGGKRNALLVLRFHDGCITYPVDGELPAWLTEFIRN